MILKFKKIFFYEINLHKELLNNFNNLFYGKNSNSSQNKFLGGLKSKAIPNQYCPITRFFKKKFFAKKNILLIQFFTSRILGWGSATGSLKEAKIEVI